MTAVSDLFRKLNVGEHRTIHVLDAPASFEAELRKLSGFLIKRSIAARESTEFALAFCVRQAELDAASKKLAKAAQGDALVWIAYPKGSSKKYKCEFNRDTGWPTLTTAGFATVRMVAIDADWCALRFRRAEFVKSTKR